MAFRLEMGSYCPSFLTLKSRLVLDVGCGGGYHMWRMLGEELILFVGIDPLSSFYANLKQSEIIGNDQRAHLIPQSALNKCQRLNAFDTVFSMGFFTTVVHP